MQDIWTKEDEQLAFSQGWGLFEMDNGFYHIQKLDDSKVFENDLDAFDYVEVKTPKCETAQKAYALDGTKF